MKQIVYNLLSNAVKFTGENGRVTLRASLVARADVGRPSRPGRRGCFPLADSEFATFLQISVADTGIGISPDDLTALFKPFSQIDSGLARKFEGTGLGLAMVKLLAELHGGVVGVESAVGEGSCFTVWLPLRAVGAETVADGQGAGTGPRSTALPGPRTALVVEDDFKSAELIRLQLEAEGFTVVHAASAEAAIVLAVQQPLVAHHARHHAAQHGRLGVSRPHQAGAGADAHSGRDHLDRRRSQPRLRARRRGHHAKADVAAGVVRGARRARLAAAGARQDAQGARGRRRSRTRWSWSPLRVKDLAGTVLRASGGREAIATARRELPDLIVLDLMMPEVNGFDVVQALSGAPDTARIPIMIVTAKTITPEDRAKLNGFVTTIVEKDEFSRDRFAAEVRRAMSGRKAVA